MNSWETQNVERKLFSDQTGRASNWAISNGYDYAAEVQTLSLEKLSNFIQSLSKILKNEDEIVWNSIDSYVWADDGFYEFEEVDQKTRDGTPKKLLIVKLLLILKRRPCLVRLYVYNKTNNPL